MINKNVIIAIIIRYLYGFRHNLDRLSDSFYWPVINLLEWGLTSLFIKNATTGFGKIVFILLSGVVFGMITWRSQYEISINLLTEFWDKNLVNMFAAPIRLREWIIAIMTLGIIKMSATLPFIGILAFLLYKFNIFIYGFLLIPFVICLIMTGWFLGFIVNGILIRVGSTMQTLAWVVPGLITPFVATSFPVSTLPKWAQTISWFVPTSHIFEGMREILNTGHFSPDKLLISFALNIAYLILSIWFFVKMFKKSRELGLNRLIS